MSAADLSPQFPPPPETKQRDSGGESERERLLATWRLHPTALVDLCSPEIAGGAEDGMGVVRMADTTGREIDEFHFATAADADEAVDYALRQINPGL